MKLTKAMRIRHVVPGCIAAVLLNFAACSSDPQTEGLQPSTTGSTTGGLPASCLAPTQTCNGGCADLATDPANCGLCGQACPLGQSCSAGVCTSACIAGQILCTNACVDVTTNSLHCGGCGVACAAGQICQGSACATGSCALGQAVCNGACVDTSVDSLNCGGCGLACVVGQTCQAGACTSMACPALQAVCGGVCTDIATVSNCGACGVVCAAGQVCSVGSCTAGTAGAITSTVTSIVSSSVTSTTGAFGTASTSVTSTTGLLATSASTNGSGGAGSATASTVTSAVTGTTGSAGSDTRPWFSFFVTSLPGLQAECGADGCGGDLGGLSGADAICTRLAQQGNPGDAKTWHAFLSTTGQSGDMVKVDAIDRVGTGPWWDWHGRMLAPDMQALLSTRPSGGDAALRVMFVDETGTDSQSSRNGEGSNNPDNHDTLTGSGKDGRLYSGAAATCQDWTSDTLQGSGQVPVGHAWPRQAGATDGNGANWIQDHTVNGCEPSVEVGQGGGACSSCFGVGDGGGYGAFFCFALNAAAP